MVFIIAGTPALEGNTVGRLLAETLAWEFVDAENLRVQGNVDAARGSTSPAHPDRTSCTEALSAAIYLWIYEWRDVVVSCPALTAGECRRMSTISSLVKVVSLQKFHASERTRASDGSASIAISQSPSGSRAPWDLARDVSTLDGSRTMEEIIAKLTAMLMT